MLESLPSRHARACGPLRQEALKKFWAGETAQYHLVCVKVDSTQAWCSVKREEECIARCVLPRAGHRPAPPGCNSLIQRGGTSGFRLSSRREPTFQQPIRLELKKTAC